MESLHDYYINADSSVIHFTRLFQGYYRMKLVKTYDSRNWPTEVEAAKMTASDHDGTTTSQPVSGASTESSAEGRPRKSLGVSPPADSPANSSGAGTSRGGRDTTFDPPQTAAKPGAKKQLPLGVGIYWPRMPCLRCGCPWWLGEDWDARCAAHYFCFRN